MGEDNGDKKIKVDVAKIKVNLDNINYKAFWFRFSCK